MFLDSIIFKENQLFLCLDWVAGTRSFSPDERICRAEELLSCFMGHAINDDFGIRPKKILMIPFDLFINSTFILCIGVL